MKTIIDRFGTSVKTKVVDDAYFTAEVEVSVSPTFFGWVIGFSGRMDIIAPDDIAERYEKFLAEVLMKHKGK